MEAHAWGMTSGGKWVVYLPGAGSFRVTARWFIIRAAVASLWACGSGGDFSNASDPATGGATSLLPNETTGGESVIGNETGGARATGGLVATGGSSISPVLTGGTQWTGGSVATGGASHAIACTTCAQGTLGGPCYASGICGGGLTCNGDHVCEGNGSSTGGARATGGAPATGGYQETGGTSSSPASACAPGTLGCSCMQPGDVCGPSPEGHGLTAVGTGDRCVCRCPSASDQGKC